MALTPLEALNKVVENSVVDLRKTGATTLSTLMANNRLATTRKTNMDWDVVFDGTGTKVVGINDENTSTDGEDNTVPANLRIGNYRISHKFRVTRTEIQEASEIAPEDLKGLFDDKIQSGLNQMVRKLNEYIWTGDGTAATAGMIGLNKVLDGTYNYAGVNSATYPAWTAPKLTNATPRDLTRALLLKFDTMTYEEEVYYNYLTCKANMYEKYINVFDSIMGASAVANNTQSPNGVKTVELGHGDAYYNGQPLVREKYAPDGSMIFMDIDGIQLVTFDDFTKPGMASADDLNRVVSSKVGGMNVNMFMHKSNIPNILQFEMYIIPQLKVKNRRVVQAIDKLNV